MLDTHVLLWANADPERLGPAATLLLVDPSTELKISSVTVAELVIKRSIGKLSMPVPVVALLDAISAVPLPLGVEHAEAVGRLPLLHRDPFDRLLAAQADVEGLVLLTADERLLAYPVDTLDARV